MASNHPTWNSLPSRKFYTARSESNGVRGYRSRLRGSLLPSPSTSSSTQAQVRRFHHSATFRVLIVLQQCLRRTRETSRRFRKRSRSVPDTSAALPASSHDVEVKPSVRHLRSLKRKRSSTEIDGGTIEKQLSGTPAEALDETVPDNVEQGEGYTETRSPTTSPLVHWVHTARWPKNFANMPPSSNASPRKRPASASYAQNARAGSVPKPHSLTYENYLAAHGVFLDEVEGRKQVREESRLMCKAMLAATYPDPPSPAFPLSDFLAVRERVRTRNEARIYRDITPLLVPSPELLYFAGHKELEHVAEEIDAEWTMCDTLGGPRPKPAMAVGLASSAFSQEDLAKLWYHTGPDRATSFTDNIWFPFLLCETKCAAGSLSQAECQNMHSSSMAVRAIIELHRVADVARAADLSGQVLVFSVSHDLQCIKVFGHFAIITPEDTSYHCYPVVSLLLDSEDMDGLKRSYSFVREVYQSFLPAHLGRIRSALALLPTPPPGSVPFRMSSDNSASQEPAADSVQSSGSSARFKRPGMPASWTQRSEDTLLREQLTEMHKQQAELRQQQAEMRQQQAEMRQQQAEMRRQLAER